MSRLKGSLSALSSLGLVAALLVNATPASAKTKGEPDKVSTKYPTIAGKTLKIGQDGESRPYSFRDPKDFKNLLGLDADLARETFACAGIKIEFITGGWSGLLPAVIAGQTDMMWDTLYYTPKRARWHKGPSPYLRNNSLSAVRMASGMSVTASGIGYGSIIVNFGCHLIDLTAE